MDDDDEEEDGTPAAMVAKYDGNQRCAQTHTHAHGLLRLIVCPLLRVGGRMDLSVIERYMLCSGSRVRDCGVRSDSGPCFL